MMKKIYLKPETKVLSLAVYGDVCEKEIQTNSSSEVMEGMYGPPGIFDNAPLF
ncbi:MAG: hypothetical protein J5548_03585 [Prevotella sp.]|nr:hypothetical protein [Prevotella sp.]